ncbi:Polyprotein P3 [Nosema granulosis]|uniref:Polyprotein P3 n=1 Tax=Nosema granulosis TaxID=83296 RepID=A0A9P6KX50_9MICR|nr:Polyprotein P3 [Nosema granulosis]
MENGVLRKFNLNWRSLIRAIEKLNGDIRLVSNLMRLNDLVEKDPYRLPLMRDIIRATQGSRVFTVIDLKEGFYHIEIEDEHKHKTDFEFDGRVYKWNSMVMGFKNSPHIMQKTMNRVLEEFRGNGVEVYMDDT